MKGTPPSRTCFSAALVVGAALLALLPAPRAIAHTPFFVAGQPIKWGPSPFSLDVVIHADSSTTVEPDAARTAIREGFRVWTDVSGAGFEFVEDTSSNPENASVSDNSHLVIFDQNNTTGFLGSTVVAITPVTVTNGQLTDADIILNEQFFDFTTVAGAPGYDLQSIIAHEAGHMLGLDHCVCIAGSLFPFASSVSTAARSLSPDDISGIRTLYPQPPGLGSISGRVARGSDDEDVTGASVAAINDAGVVIASTFTDGNGLFTLERLPSDLYFVAVEPFDGPVSDNEISLSSTIPVMTNFGSTFHGGSTTPTLVGVAGTSQANVGTIPVGPSEVEFSGLNPSTSARAVRGTERGVQTSGSGLGASDLTFRVTGTGVTVVGSTFSGGFRNVTISIAPDAALGPRSLVVEKSTGAIAFLTGAIEVVDPAPTIDSISPPVADGGGGVAVTISGDGFHDGALVFFGGLRGTNVDVVDSATIEVLTPPGLGETTVQVQNPDGQVGVEEDGIAFGLTPVIDNLFPAAGTIAGGTVTSLHGTGFEPDAVVDFIGPLGGVRATVLSVDASFRRIEVETPPGLVGPVQVRVTNPLGFFDLLDNAYTYLDHPDPTIDSITPSSGKASGGETVNVRGTGFLAGVSVLFSTEPDGSDGVAGVDLERVSETELNVVTPALDGGVHTVVVLNPDGSKACLVDAYFSEAPAASSSSGGGGGCSAIAPVFTTAGSGGHSRGGPGFGHTAGALLPWVLLVLFALSGPWRRRRRAHPATPPLAG